jgi:hypothetical protein
MTSQQTQVSDDHDGQANNHYGRPKAAPQSAVTQLFLRLFPRLPNTPEWIVKIFHYSPMPS